VIFRVQEWNDTIEQSSYRSDAIDPPTNFESTMNYPLLFNHTPGALVEAPDYGVYDYISDPRKIQALKKHRAWNYHLESADNYFVEDWIAKIVVVEVKPGMSYNDIRRERARIIRDDLRERLKIAENNCEVLGELK
jgi:hypothetical protein